MMKRLRKVFLSVSMILILVSFVLVPSFVEAQGKPAAIYGKGDSTLVVATGSPGALGLVKALSAPFCHDNNCRLIWFKKGSGASLSFMKTGKCDVIMVHAQAAEKKAVSDGWAINRTVFGANEFFIVGPKSDPAGIAKATTAKEAYAMIARAGAKFFSRGDNSGTNKRELKIWHLAGIKPVGSWYIVTHAFMGPTLMRADKEMGYFMTDNSTYYVKKAKLKQVVPLFKGDPMLLNVYHALMPNTEKYPGRNTELARRFISFVASGDGQTIIRTYGVKKYGRPLYQDAATAKKLEN
jgi:tungstate transport system substrate-binding protein